MPTSPYCHTKKYIEFLDQTQPSSILDIGLGNGKLGFIARDYLDVMLGQRHLRESWKIKIDGIEIFADYIQDHQKAIYNDIYVGDALEIITQLGSYDLIVLGDVIEHFTKDQAHQLLDRCVEHSDKNIIVFIPLGSNWTQPEIYGNPHETHRSFWEVEDFMPLACDCEIFEFTPGSYGAFLIRKVDYINFKIEELYSQNPRSPLKQTLELRDRYGLNKTNIEKIDLARFNRHIANAEHSRYFSDVNFQEHYRLIAYLSTLFNYSIIFDIGSNLGYSALALSFNPTNAVVSYDIADYRELNYSEELTTIEYLIGDVLQDRRLLDSPLLMLDTNHDGKFERKLFDYLNSNGFRGLLFLDDIHLNQPMRDFWDSIDKPKEDITDLGHWSGSGIVDFGS